MADIFIPEFIEETSSGIFARHASRALLPILTAPTTLDRQAAENRVRQQLVTVACANLKDFAFAFDSSFIDTTARDGFDRLAKLMFLYPGSPISLFGHADADGDPLYNKFLSERRARAVFAFLLRRTAIWEQIFSDAAERAHVRGDDWGLRSLRIMLEALGFSAGPPDEPKLDRATADALADFVGKQTGTRPAAGRNDAPTRALLFAAYMDFLAPDDPAKRGTKFQLAPERFLGGAKGTIEGPGDFQGCSEFNPQMIFAAEETRTFARNGDIGTALRHAANEVNRRVIIYLFEPGTTKPTTWPCPSARQGIAGCKARFWSDGEARRSTAFEQHRRRFGREVPVQKAVLAQPKPALAARMQRAETTFGCRFYHGFGLRSPCERDLRMWVIRLLAGGNARPIGNARFVARMGTDAAAPLIRGTTSANGTLALPVFDDIETITFKVDAFRALFGSAPRAGAPKEPDEPLPKEAATDPDAFPDEGNFIALTLDAGALQRIQLPAGAEPPFDPNAPAVPPDFDSIDAPPLSIPERDAGVGQRLANLGFGGNELATDPAARRAAVAAFQRFFRAAAQATGDIDDETVRRLAATYGDVAETDTPP
ncbi:MAG: OmpA family protein [Gemmatimonadota bacterium]